MNLPNHKKPEQKFEIPALNRAQRRTLFKHWKIFFTTGIVGLVLLLALVTFTTIKLATWFDSYSLSAQNPIMIAIRQPFIIRTRLPLSPIPHATYVEVSPLTTPQQIDNSSKTGTIPQYADAGGISPVSPDMIRTLIKNKVIEKYGLEYWKEVDYIIMHESGYQPYIVNKSSGACGLFQALPCSKLPSLDITDQIYWAMNVYFPQHYNGSIQAAYDHKKATGWY